MLPIYLTYFAGGDAQNGRKGTVINALSFVGGFTLVFLILGAFAGVVGGFLTRHQTLVNLITGAVVVLFGLAYMEILPLPFFRGMARMNVGAKLSSGRSFLLGIVFSVAWTPCVGAFLGSALLLAAQQGSAQQGMLMLLFYALGLGIPFAISALIMDKLKDAFAWIRAHFRAIRIASGALLIVMGLLMMLGLMQKVLVLFG